MKKNASMKNMIIKKIPLESMIVENLKSYHWRFKNIVIGN